MQHLQLRGESIGTGATATVVAGHYVGAHNTVYAIKRFKAGREKDFVREKEALERLRHLPGVLQLHSVGVVRQRPALVLEMCRHGDLMRVMQAIPGFGLPSRVARVFARQLWSAVAAMHERGVYHMDIKLENCLVGSDDFALKLCDFGFAHTEFDDIGRSKCGTVKYMAPEVLASDHRKPYSRAKADCWSAGVTAFAFAVGEHPISPQAGKYQPSLMIEGGADLPSVLEADFGITLHPNGSRVVAAVTPKGSGAYHGVKPGCSVLKEVLVCGNKREVTFSCRTENWYFKALRLRRYDDFWRGLLTFSTDPDGLAELGDDGKDFLLDALKVSPEHRPTAAEMCGSAWLKGDDRDGGGDECEMSGDESESFLSEDGGSDVNGKFQYGHHPAFSSHDREIVADFFMNELGIGSGV